MRASGNRLPIDFPARTRQEVFFCPQGFFILRCYFHMVLLALLLPCFRCNPCLFCPSAAPISHTPSGEPLRRLLSSPCYGSATVTGRSLYSNATGTAPSEADFWLPLRYARFDFDFIFIFGFRTPLLCSLPSSLFRACSRHRRAFCLSFWAKKKKRKKNRPLDVSKMVTRLSTLDVSCDREGLWR